MLLSRCIRTHQMILQMKMTRSNHGQSTLFESRLPWNFILWSHTYNLSHQIHFAHINLLFQGSVSSHLNDRFCANDNDDDSNHNHCKKWASRRLFIDKILSTDFIYKCFPLNYVSFRGPFRMKKCKIGPMPAHRLYYYSLEIL